MAPPLHWSQVRKEELYDLGGWEGVMGRQGVRWLSVAILGFAITAGSLSCGAVRLAHRAAPARRELAVDTTVVIIRVFNYQPAEVTVYMDVHEQRQRVGVVTPMHEAFFVLPSTEGTAVDELFLTVV